MIDTPHNPADIIRPAEPLPPVPVRPANLGIALWFICLGAIVFSVFLAATLIFTLLGLMDGQNIPERLSGTPLYLFAGSFGMVPGALLYVWGNTLLRRGASRALALYLLTFTLPLIGLAGFLNHYNGRLWAALTLICVIALALIATVIWRAAGRMRRRAQ